MDRANTRDRRGSLAVVLACTLAGCGSSSGEVQADGPAPDSKDAGTPDAGMKDVGASGGAGGQADAAVSGGGIDGGQGGMSEVGPDAGAGGNTGGHPSDSGGKGGLRATGGGGAAGGVSGAGGLGVGGNGGAHGGAAGGGGAGGGPGGAGGAVSIGFTFSPCAAMGIAQIRSLAYLADGSGVVAALAGGVAKIIAPSDGRELHNFIGHAGGVNAVAVSGDGKTLVSASDDGTVKLWRISDGALLTTLTGESHALLSVAISPDGTRIAAGAADGQLFLWNGTSGALLGTKTDHVDQVRGLAFAAAGTRLFSASKDGSVRVWSATDLTAIATPVSGGTWMNALAVSADGAHVAVGDAQGGLSLRRASDGALERQLQAMYGVTSLAYAPDGTRVYAAISGPSITVFPVDGSAPTLLLAPIGDTALVAAAPDGNSLFITTDWALWSISSTGTHLRDPIQQGPFVRDVAFTPDGGDLVVGGDFGLAVRSLPDGAVAQSPDWSQFAALYNAVDVSPDGTRLATADDEGAVRLWSTATWQTTSQLAQAPVRAQDVACSPDGTLIAIAGDQGTDEVYTAANGAIDHGLGYGDNIHVVTFSPDGLQLAIGTENGELGIVMTADFSDARRLTDVHSPTVMDVAFSPDHQLIASTGDTRVTLWQTTGSAPRRDVFVGPSDFTGSTVAVSPDGTALVAGGSDGQIRAWSVPDLTPLAGLPGHGPGVVKARFSPDGTRLAVGYDDGTVWLWCR